MTDEMLAWQTERFLDLETHRDGHVVCDDKSADEADTIQAVRALLPSASSAAIA